MKSKVVKSEGGGELSGVRGTGKVEKASSRHRAQANQQPEKIEENQEIKQYLSKLQELVPFMPKNRKLTKLEVITHVIDYIRDLRVTLGLPPCITEGSPFDMQSAMILQSGYQSVNNSNSITIQNHPRQPLCPISNTTVNSSLQEQSAAPNQESHAYRR